MPAIRNSADPRLARLLAELPHLGVPVLPADHLRIRAVLPRRRTPSPETFEHTLVALLAKDAGQRRICHEGIERLFGEDFIEEEAWRQEEEEEDRRRIGQGAPDGTPGSDAHQQHPGQTEPASGPARQGEPERRVPIFGLALALALLTILAGAVGWWMTRSPDHPPKTEETPAPLITPTAADRKETLLEHPIDRFNTWVPVLVPEPAALTRPWAGATALLATALAAVGWLLARGRTIARPPAEAERYRFEKAGRQRRLGWSADDRRLPPPLAREQRREMVWGVQHFAEDRPSPRIDADATVDATARLARPEVRFAAAHRTREVWLWRDQWLEDDQADTLIRQVDQALGQAGLRPRNDSFTALPDPVHLDIDPDGRARTRLTRDSPRDLGSEAREALAAIFTDGRGLAAALRAARPGPPRPAGSWPSSAAGRVAAWWTAPAAAWMSSYRGLMWVR